MKSLLLLFTLSFCSVMFFTSHMGPKVAESFPSHPTLDSCDHVTITPGNNSIVVRGINTAPIVNVQVFNSSWASVFNQAYTTPQDSVVVSLSPGQYVVSVKFYTSGWVVMCEKSATVTVSSNPPPPPPPTDTCGPTFKKSFGTAGGDESGIDLVKTQDGGYMAAGFATGSGSTTHDALLMKFDARGNMLWSKTFGGSQEDYFMGVIATSDGGYLAAGSTNATGYLTFDGDAWIVKTDANGNIQWQKKYPNSGGSGFINSIIQTSEGGYAFIGDAPWTPGLSNWMIVKTDPNGNITWQKKFGTGNSDDGIGIVEDNHGGSGLVVTGYHYGGTYYDADIVKFDLSTGGLLWSKSWDIDGRTNRFNHIVKVSDGFLINAVNHDGWYSDNAVEFVVKTDFNGNLLFNREFKASPSAGDGHVIQLADGGYLVEESDLIKDANTDIHLMRVDATGNILWTKKYPQPDLQIGNRILLDGNYVVGVGNTKNGTNNDVLLFKADLSGKMGSCANINETGTTRIPSIVSLTPTFSVNANNDLVPTNTGVSAVTFNPASTVICMDSCNSIPTVSISNVSVNESAGNAVLQVCLSTTSTQQVTVQYATANGTATAGSDYTASNGTATIPAGQTCTTITIPIINDATQESTENFTVNLSNAVNASITAGIGTVTINDDDQPQVNCNAVTFNPGNQSIIISGLTAPIAAIQIFNSSWATVFNQAYTNSPGTVTVSLAPGTYLAKVTFYTSGWVYICDKSQNVTVVNQCQPGTICAFNTCPSQTVNLGNYYSLTNLPVNTFVTFHTGSPATTANRMTPAQWQSVTTSGVYYAAINFSISGCYSETIPIIVTITPCGNSANMSELQVKTAGEMPSGKIMVYPNPFTHSVTITMQSEKNEKAVLVLTDLMGQQLRTKPVQLARGSNQFSLEGLDQFPTGSYLLKVASSDGIQTFKLLRQQ